VQSIIGSLDFTGFDANAAKRPAQGDVKVDIGSVAVAPGASAGARVVTFTVTLTNTGGQFTYQPALELAAAGEDGSTVSAILEQTESGDAHSWHPAKLGRSLTGDPSATGSLYSLDPGRSTTVPYRLTLAPADQHTAFKLAVGAWLQPAADTTGLTQVGQATADVTAPLAPTTGPTH
jgi:hypothetical protein